jgi:hypothetical protein
MPSRLLRSWSPVATSGLNAPAKRMPRLIRPRASGLDRAHGARTALPSQVGASMTPRERSMLLQGPGVAEIRQSLGMVHPGCVSRGALKHLLEHDGRGFQNEQVENGSRRRFR